jgi:hypothetical protein
MYVAFVDDVSMNTDPENELTFNRYNDFLYQHYLVAEYFMVAPFAMTPEILYAKTKQEQADIIWKALFVERTPLSEATRGVGTL